MSKRKKKKKHKNKKRHFVTQNLASASNPNTNVSAQSAVQMMAVPKEPDSNQSISLKPNSKTNRDSKKDISDYMHYGYVKKEIFSTAIIVGALIVGLIGLWFLFNHSFIGEKTYHFIYSLLKV